MISSRRFFLGSLTGLGALGLVKSSQVSAQASEGGASGAIDLGVGPGGIRQEHADQPLA